MLALAGDFGKMRLRRSSLHPSPVPNGAGNVIARSIAQQRENRHSQTLRFGSELKDVPLPREPIADQAVPGITHSFERTSDREIAMLSRKDSIVFRAIVEYAVGSGRHGITMLGRDEEGIECELRVSYSGRDGTWRQTKGITFAPQQPGDHNGVALGQKEVNHCLSCHSTWFRSVAPDHAAARPPEGEDRGIGCERCHGPGLHHVRAAETGFGEMAIMLGTKTPSRAAQIRALNATPKTAQSRRATPNSRASRERHFSRAAASSQTRIASRAQPATTRMPLWRRIALATRQNAWAATCPSLVPRRPRQPPPVAKRAPSTPPRIAFHATCRRWKIRRGMRGSRTITFAPTGARARREPRIEPAAGAHPR